MHDGFNPRERVPSAQGLERLSEVGDVRAQERNVILWMGRLRARNEVDVQDIVSALADSLRRLLVSRTDT